MSVAVCAISGVWWLDSSVPLLWMKFSRLGICSRSDATLRLSRVKWTLSNWSQTRCWMLPSAACRRQSPDEESSRSAKADRAGLAASPLARGSATIEAAVVRRAAKRSKAAAMVRVLSGVCHPEEVRRRIRTPRVATTDPSQAQDDIRNLRFAQVFQRTQDGLLLGVELVRYVFENGFRWFAVRGDALEAFANDLVAVGHQLARAVL